MPLSVEASLDLFQIPYTRTTGHYVVRCPYHSPDNNPSGKLELGRGYFCYGCKTRSSIKEFYAAATGKSLREVNTAVGIAHHDKRKALNMTEIERMHRALLTHDRFLAALRYRCITDTTIRINRLGLHDGRIAIPIPNAAGEYVNIRLYLPGAVDEPKFLSLRGCNSTGDVYPWEQLEYERILLCGGELKALAASQILNDDLIGCISTTSGESEWNNKITALLRDKTVYVCNDVDAAGVKATFTRCNALHNVARKVYAIYLKPEDVGGEPKGDINDVLRVGGSLHRLLADAPEWAYLKTNVLEETYPVEMEYAKAFSPGIVGHKTKIVAAATAIGDKVYIIPTKIVVTCGKGRTYCDICPVAQGNETMHIHPEHQDLLDYIDVTRQTKESKHRSKLGIPPICNVHELNEDAAVSIASIRINDAENCESQHKLAYIVDPPVAIDIKNYALTGRMHPSPKDQTAVYLASDLIPSEGVFDNDINISGLEVFQCEPTLEGIQQRLDEIYTDLEANVTGIYFRRDLHLVYDLVYHSPLQMQINNTTTKGYVELLAVGDTGQGKSRAVDTLRQHYKLGGKIDCKIATIAGMTIGVDKALDKHFAVYGAMPKHDKQLLVLEELKGMPHNVFQALTEVRSSGRVQITKIVSATRPARVRLIAITNPPDSRTISTYTYGVDSAVEVVGTQEDVRRFDLAIFLDKRDIDIITLSELLEHPPIVEHKFTSDLCYRLLKRIWSVETVTFEDKGALYRLTRELVPQYESGSTLLDSASSAEKIARLAASLAGRLNSFTDTGEILVRCAHIEYIGLLLARLYDSRSCNMRAKHNSVIGANIIRDDEGLVAYINSMPNALLIANKLIEMDLFSIEEIRAIVGDYSMGAMLFSKFLSHNAIKKTTAKGMYMKTPDMTDLLKRISGTLVSNAL